MESQFSILRLTIYGKSIQHFEADFLWKVNSAFEADFLWKVNSAF